MLGTCEINGRVSGWFASHRASTAWCRKQSMRYGAQIQRNKAQRSAKERRRAKERKQRKRVRDASSGNGRAVTRSRQRARLRARARISRGSRLLPSARRNVESRAQRCQSANAPRIVRPLIDRNRTRERACTSASGTVANLRVDAFRGVSAQTSTFVARIIKIAVPAIQQQR